MTLLQRARDGIITPAISAVARAEELDPETVRRGVAEGRLVIPQNRRRQFPPVGIGAGLSTKVNANIGTSPSHGNLDEELGKLDVCVKAGAHSLMDLSTGGDLVVIRRAIIAEAPLMVGTVPLYGLASRLEGQGQGILAMEPEALFDEIGRHCADGVDFITVHCGVTQAALGQLEQCPRLLGIVSRGGSLLARWMGYHGRENPLFQQFERLLEICAAHDVTLSLGDGLRPGALLDSSDAAQIHELTTLGQLATRARRRGVQVMVEGPGHVPLDQIAGHVQLQKRLCDGAPFYVLGPLPTDIGAGYDHITSAIGGALAAMHGADFLCYVTAAEHLRLPTIDEVREGVIAARLAAHCGDLVKLGQRAQGRDRAVSAARRRLDWQGMFDNLLDPVMARHKRGQSEDADRDVCSMCGELCAIRTFQKFCEDKKP
jgi:phosphomethylpyrimidine synthase